MLKKIGLCLGTILLIGAVSQDKQPAVTYSWDTRVEETAPAAKRAPVKTQSKSTVDGVRSKTVAVKPPVIRAKLAPGPEPTAYEQARSHCNRVCVAMQPVQISHR